MISYRGRPKIAGDPPRDLLDQSAILRILYSHRGMRNGFSVADLASRLDWPKWAVKNSLRALETLLRDTHMSLGARADETPAGELVPHYVLLSPLWSTPDP